MSRQVQAERFALAREAHGLAPVGQRLAQFRHHFRGGRRRLLRETEQVILARCERAGLLFRGLHRTGQLVHMRRSIRAE